MAEIEIVKMGAPIKMSGTVARSNPASAAAPKTTTTPQATSETVAPTVPAKPVQGAPPVPPPVEPKGKPFENKSKKEFFDRLKSKSGPKSQEPEPPKEPETPQEPETTEEPPPETPETTESPETPQTPEPQADTKAGPKPKVNPWKLVDEWKGKVATLEQQLLETKKLIPDEVARKGEVERLTRAESRAKELEDEIRYVNYSKSQDFKDKFDQPYQDAFKDAMADLVQIEIQTEDGGVRPANHNDLLALVNAQSLTQAKQIAQERFGEFADEAMAHRKTVHKLWTDRVRALESARKFAAEREQQMNEQYQSSMKEISTFLQDNWKKANDAIHNDPEHAEFFKEIEGDQERNTILSKGYEFADQALQGNPMDPSLKPEERAAIVKRHAALRNKAAAYGTLKFLLAKERAEKAAMAEKLKQYEGSTPGTSPAPRNTANGVHSRTTDQVFSKLRGLARR